MAAPISGSLPALPPLPAASRPTAAAGPIDFGEALGKLVAGVDQASDAANVAIADMLDRRGDVHDAMIAMNQAEIALQLTVQVRNKIVQAYHDVMHMPV